MPFHENELPDVLRCPDNFIDLTVDGLAELSCGPLSPLEDFYPVQTAGLCERELLTSS
jgi:hypothetical protein